MPAYKRQDMADLLQTLRQGKIFQLYLVVGERFLCREAAEELIDCLLPGATEKKQQVQNIDGDQEDFSRTLNQLRTFSLFPGRRVFRVTDSRLFFSKGVAKTLWEKAAKEMAAKEPDKASRTLRQMLNAAGTSSAEQAEEGLAGLAATRWKNLFGFPKPAGDLAWADELLAGESAPAAANAKQPAAADLADQFTAAFEAGIPADHVLLLTAEAADKRKRFYKYIEKHGAIIDLTVESGGSSAARKDQDAVLQALVLKTLAGFGKKLEARAMPLLLERIGFQPAAAVLETEKLALSVGDAPLITVADLDAVIGRTREEALYELTDAFTRQQLEEALLIVARLQENGIHALAIVATLRNHIRKLLLIRSFQELPEPAYSRGMQFAAFQKNYLPLLKTAHEEWPDLWKSHPYALYMQFQQAERFSGARLQKALKELLAAEFSLKGSAVPAPLILDNLLLLLIEARAAGRRAAA